MPSLVQAISILVLVAIPIDVLSQWAGWINPDEEIAMRSTITSTPIKELIFVLLIKAPLIQEFLYRGPVRLLVFFFPDFTVKNWITWLVILVPTYYWGVIDGGGHYMPFDALFVGIVAGWVVAETKSLEPAIVLHMSYNGLSLIGALIKYRLLMY